MTIKIRESYTRCELHLCYKYKNEYHDFVHNLDNSAISRANNVYWNVLGANKNKSIKKLKKLVKKELIKQGWKESANYKEIKKIFNDTYFPKNLSDKAILKRVYGYATGAVEQEFHSSDDVNNFRQTKYVRR